MSSFPHAKSLRIVGDAAAGEIVSALRSGSVARLAIAKNNVVRDCECLDQLVGLRALYITECRNLAPSLGRMPQLKSLDLGSTLRASAGLALRAGACESRQCVDDVACCGLGWVAGWAVAGGVILRGRAEGRRCVQAIPSEMMEQRRWHRVSKG